MLIETIQEIKSRRKSIHGKNKNSRIVVLFWIINNHIDIMDWMFAFQFKTYQTNDKKPIYHKDIDLNMHAPKKKKKRPSKSMKQKLRETEGIENPHSQLEILAVLSQ